jgi:hypothetical protein
VHHMWSFAVEGGWCSVLDVEYVRATSEPARTVSPAWRGSRKPSELLAA